MRNIEYLIEFCKVMVAHIVEPRTQGKGLQATVSKKSQPTLSFCLTSIIVRMLPKHVVFIYKYYIQF